MPAINQLSDLRTYTFFPETVFVQGYNSIGDGGEGHFYWDNVDSTSVDNDGTIIIVTGITTGRWKRVYSGSLNVKWFGFMGIGTLTDTAKLQSLLNYCTTLTYANVILIPPGLYQIANAITFYTDFTSIEATGATIDASLITSTMGSAILIKGTGVGMLYNQSTNSVKGLSVYGSITTGVTGILFDGPNAAAAATGYNLYDLSIHNFDIGVYFKNNAYNIDFYSTNIYSCNICVYNAAGVINGGERLTFHGCTIFNSDLAIKMNNANGAFHLVNCSLDYNVKQVEIDQGRVSLYNCHIESSLYTGSPFTVTGDGSNLTVDGGWLLQTASTTLNPYVVESSSPNTIITFINLFMNHNHTTSNRFHNGVGRIFIKNISTYNTTENVFLLSDNENLMIDGSFENPTIVDNIFITDDTATITSPLSGANINLSLSTVEKRTGAQSLQITKTFGGGSACACALAIPIDKMVRPGCELYFSKPGSETGTIFISFCYGALKNSPTVVPYLDHFNIYAGSTITLTSAPTGWVRYATGEPSLITPSWATHYIILFELNVFNGPGSIFIDDILITQM